LGNDTLNGGTGNDTLLGGLGNDIYIVDSDQDAIGDTGGIDTVQTLLNTFSLASIDSLIVNMRVLQGEYPSLTSIENLTFTGTGDATLTGNALNNILTGGTGNDTLNGGLGNDTMIGGAGNDTYVVNSISDVVTESSGRGTDTIQTTLDTYSIASLTNVENLSYTGSNHASLTGNLLANTLIGSLGNDMLTGGAGNDTLNGGDGADTLKGGLGNDVLTGGSGNDLFVFDTRLSATSNKDTITDFSHADDTIQLLKSIMTGLGALGELSANDFKFSGEALDLSDRIIYNKTTGGLFYDADGSGSTSSVQVALIGTVSHPMDLDHTDFMII